MELTNWVKIQKAKHTGKYVKYRSYGTHLCKLWLLQKLPGHMSIKTTGDRYVHMTDDSINKAVQQFEMLFA